MKCIIGKENVLRQAPEVLSDESRFTLGIPQKVCYPSTAEEIRAIVLEADAHKIPLTIIGGKTGITGGSVPNEDCIAICLSAMNRILGIELSSAGEPLLVCEPGTTLASIAHFCDFPGQSALSMPGKEKLAPLTWMYPPDPTEMTAQLGGTVATNASGARSFRFGPTRSHVEKISCIFGNGDTLTIRRGDYKESNNTFSFVTDQGNKVDLKKPQYDSPFLKNACGYFSRKNMDLIDLFIGSEGTLAIFSRIWITLAPKPRFSAGLSFFPDCTNAFSVASFLRQQSSVAAIEYFDAGALRLLQTSGQSMSLDLPDFPAGANTAVYWEFLESEKHSFENCMDEWEAVFKRYGSSFENTWSGFEPEEIARLKTFRHAVPEAINTAIAHHNRLNPKIKKISTDASFPAATFEKTMKEWFELLEICGLEYTVFGHLGDYHLHCNIIPHDEIELTSAKSLYEKLMESTISSGGTVSGEHGIGKLKTAYLARMYGVGGIDEMIKVKSTLDPWWLLNRGNLFNPPIPGGSAHDPSL